MTSEQIEAAEARYRKASELTLDDAHTLAMAYLELRDAKEADEAERALPVTREWLETFGFSNEGGRFVRGQLQITFYEEWNFWWAVSGFSNASSRLVDGLNTRGQVLDLLKALGVGVKG